MKNICSAYKETKVQSLRSIVATTQQRTFMSWLLHRKVPQDASEKKTNVCQVFAGMWGELANSLIAVKYLEKALMDVEEVPKSSVKMAEGASGVRGEQNICRVWETRGHWDGCKASRSLTPRAWWGFGVHSGKNSWGNLCVEDIEDNGVKAFWNLWSWS